MTQACLSQKCFVFSYPTKRPRHAYGGMPRYRNRSKMDFVKPFRDECERRAHGFRSLSPELNDVGGFELLQQHFVYAAIAYQQGVEMMLLIAGAAAAPANMNWTEIPSVPFSVEWRANAEDRKSEDTWELLQCPTNTLLPEDRGKTDPASNRIDFIFWTRTACSVLSALI